MTLSEFHEGTIEAVRVTLCLREFECDPDHITGVLGIQPDETRRRGEDREIGVGRQISNRANQWALRSRSDSKDVNVQIRDILERLGEVAKRIEPGWHPFFDVVWKGNYLYAGSGPFYERDVLAGVAQIGAEIYQDIYQVDRNDLDE